MYHPDTGLARRAAGEMTLLAPTRLVFRRVHQLIMRFGAVGGGSGSPFTTVTSRPRPPRGPVSRYWPDRGAISPGRNGPLVADIAALP
jgi:hypothetical protein